MRELNSEPRNGAFTILELLVVATILAITAGALIVALGSTQTAATTGVATAEMANLRNALSRYRRDLGSFPTLDNPADFSKLYVQGSQPTWVIDVARGWRGPYLTRLGEGLVDIGDDLEPSGTGVPTSVTSSPHLDVRSVADPFIHWPIRTGTSATRCADTEPDTNCLLDWRSQAGDTRHRRWGRPYLLFELDRVERARIVSMGPNGLYETQACAGINCNECSPGGDDLVLCLAQ